MVKIIVATHPDGHISLTPVNPKHPEGSDEERISIAKALFSVSFTEYRTITLGVENRYYHDANTRFDPAVHTLDAIAAGLPRHYPLTYRECTDADLPTDRYFRDAWVWSD